jgi:6-phosphogluconate dehydrogenase
MKKQDIGIIGLGPMGENLTLNIESKGYSVVVFNRTDSKTKSFIDNRAKEKDIIPAYSINDFVNLLKSPRKILLMVKEGKPVDEFIETLLPLLNKGDLIIDGGNSHYKDTMRRNVELSKIGILYLGTGISGGEEGALKGPSLMPGGQIEAYKIIEKIFTDIAAKTEDGAPCLSYIGPHGAGHFVKMVHNGIEYGDMQLIGECAWMLRNALDIPAEQIADIMFRWNDHSDVLQSYLIEITGYVEREKDKTYGGHLIDRIADITEMKGTGTWTVQASLELNVPVPTIAAAVFSREISMEKELRMKMSTKIPVKRSEFSGDPQKLIDIGHDALYISKISSYAQGIALLKSASSKYGFGLNISDIAKTWRGGCIIRARFLNEIAEAYKNDPGIPNLLAAENFNKFINQNLYKLAKFIEVAHTVGVPTLAMDSAYDYILQLTSPIMVSAQLSALQRDYFGAHGYFRIESQDNPRILTTAEGKTRQFHTEWMLSDRPEKEFKN